MSRPQATTELAPVHIQLTCPIHRTSHAQPHLRQTDRGTTTDLESIAARVTYRNIDPRTRGMTNLPVPGRVRFIYRPVN